MNIKKVLGIFLIGLGTLLAMLTVSSEVPALAASAGGGPGSPYPGTGGDQAAAGPEVQVEVLAP